MYDVGDLEIVQVVGDASVWRVYIVFIISSKYMRSKLLFLNESSWFGLFGEVTCE